MVYICSLITAKEICWNKVGLSIAENSTYLSVLRSPKSLFKNFTVFWLHFVSYSSKFKNFIKSLFIDEYHYNDNKNRIANWFDWLIDWLLLPSIKWQITLLHAYRMGRPNRQQYEFQIHVFKDALKLPVGFWLHVIKFSNS